MKAPTGSWPRTSRVISLKHNTIHHNTETGIISYLVGYFYNDNITWWDYIVLCVCVCVCVCQCWWDPSHNVCKIWISRRFYWTFLYSILVKITKNNKKCYIKTHSHFCKHLESNSHKTHKKLTTVNYVLNNCYRKKEKAQSIFSATFCVPYS